MTATIASTCHIAPDMYSKIHCVLEICLDIPEPFITLSNVTVYVHVHRSLCVKLHKTEISPRIRPEVAAFWHCPVGTSLPVATLLEHFGSPPFKIVHPAREDESKKNDHQPEGQTRIKSSTQSHGIFGPPVGRPASNHVVEDVAYQCPDGEVKSSGWRNPRETSK